jgi:hypothetical protein
MPGGRVRSLGSRAIRAAGLRGLFKMMQLDERQAVIAEARTWIGTTFHDRARVKGAGVDCLQLLIASYHAAGLLPDLRPDYPVRFFLHGHDEIYLGGIADYAVEIATPHPADFALFKFGRCFSHAALVIDWPVIVHAFSGQSVQEDDASRNFRLTTIGEVENGRGQPRPVKFFTLKRWAIEAARCDGYSPASQQAKTAPIFYGSYGCKKVAG